MATTPRKPPATPADAAGASSSHRRTWPTRPPPPNSSRRPIPNSAVSTPFGAVLRHLGYQNVDIETLATLVSLGRLDLSRSISDIVSLEDVRVGIETLERQEGNPIRILVKP